MCSCTMVRLPIAPRTTSSVTDGCVRNYGWCGLAPRWPLVGVSLACPLLSRHCEMKALFSELDHTTGFEAYPMRV